MKPKGNDGDMVNVFIGPEPERDTVYVVDQLNPDDGSYDEAKCMIGFSSEEQAKLAYRSNYAPGWKGFGGITALSMDQFKEWLSIGDTTQPLSYIHPVSDFPSLTIATDKPHKFG